MTAPARSFRAAVNAKCRDCIYDPLAKMGAWREQVEACTATGCPLHSFRPLSFKEPKGTRKTATADAPQA
jgi:hypothetical protein